MLRLLVFFLCIMLHGGVFARLVLLWTWLLENLVDVGDWKAYGSAQLLVVVTIPYPWPCLWLLHGGCSEGCTRHNGHLDG